MRPSHRTRRHPGSIRGIMLSRIRDRHRPPDSSADALRGSSPQRPQTNRVAEGREGHEPGAGGDPGAPRAALPGRSARPGLARADRRGRGPAQVLGVPPAARDGRRGLRHPPGRRAPLRPGCGRLRDRQRIRPSGASAADRPPARSRPWSTRVGHSAHLAMLHGRDVLYVLEERAPGRPPLVTDVGVRLPAHLTASGRAILAALPASAGPGALPGPLGLRGPARHRPHHPRHAAAPAGRDPATRATPPRTARSPPASPRWLPRSSTTTATRSRGWQ